LTKPVLVFQILVSYTTFQEHITCMTAKKMNHAYETGES